MTHQIFVSRQSGFDLILALVLRLAMKEVSFLPGEQIIREGDDGDCQALVVLSAMLAPLLL